MLLWSRQSSYGIKNFELKVEIVKYMCPYAGARSIVRKVFQPVV